MRSWLPALPLLITLTNPARTTHAILQPRSDSPLVLPQFHHRDARYTALRKPPTAPTQSCFLPAASLVVPALRSDVVRGSSRLSLEASIIKLKSFRALIFPWLTALIRTNRRTKPRKVNQHTPSAVCNLVDAIKPKAPDDHRVKIT